tara:strand:- start:411 stop:857 length:447 start_codon:yes stop_codon:yes gene_type:complete
MRRYIYLKKKVMTLFSTVVSTKADGKLGDFLKLKQEWIKDGGSDLNLQNAIRGHECHMLEPDFYTRKREDCPMDEPIIWVPNAPSQLRYAEVDTKPGSYSSGSYYLAVEFVLASEHGSALGKDAPEPIQIILERCGVAVSNAEDKKTR